ncbi:MAG TPA: hypothetical protein VL625_03680 [Patescibacteria group bacterium]|nr:hypothetical protein [Patescibacteria group bacterium]
MFDSCDFLLGKDQTIIIVIPEKLPRAETYTVSVTDKNIVFKAGQNNVGEVPYQGEEVYKRIAGNIQIGLVEYPPYSRFPDHITQVAYVEVRRAA